ncbi:aspartate/glutamate racemase family protein [Thermodesulfobacteriota bacterium]
MKIWVQSMSSYRFDPIFDDYGRIIEEQCKRAVRPGTEVYVTGVPKLMKGMTDKYKSVMTYHNIQNLNNMLKAQEQGYDAFFITCSFDVGMEEGREMLEIPVVGLAHASLFMAAMLGELFAIVTCEPYIAERYRQMVTRYGLVQKFLQGPYVAPISEWELAESLGKDTSDVAEKFKVVARKAVAEGASVIVPVPAVISQLFGKEGGLTKLDGATVLDPITVGVKMAEMMIDLKKLGIEVSRTLQVGGSLGKEAMDACLETYSSLYNFDNM